MSSTGSCEPSVMLACLFNASNCGSRGRSAQIFLYHCNGLMPQNQILAEHQRLTSGTEGWKFPSLKYRTLGFLVFFFRCWIYSSYSFDLRIQNKIHMVPKYESLQRTEKFGSNKIYFFFKFACFKTWWMSLCSLSESQRWGHTWSFLFQVLSASSGKGFLHLLRASVLTRICLLRWGSRVSAASPTQ